MLLSHSLAYTGLENCFLWSFFLWMCIERFSTTAVPSRGYIYSPLPNFLDPLFPHSCSAPHPTADTTLAWSPPGLFRGLGVKMHNQCNIHGFFFFSNLVQFVWVFCVQFLFFFFAFNLFVTCRHSTLCGYLFFIYCPCLKSKFLHTFLYGLLFAFLLSFLFLHSDKRWWMHWSCCQCKKE